MSFYEAPRVIVNQDTSEGIYMASGAKAGKNKTTDRDVPGEAFKATDRDVPTKAFKTTHRDIAVDVLVLGVRGAGKTSLLATMLYDRNDLLKNKGLKFTADDDTKTRLKNAIDKMRDMVESGGELAIGEGLAGTVGLSDFNFQLKFEGNSWGETPDFRIAFHDYQGGILTGDTKDKDYEKLAENFLKSQIVFILVDTPYLMEGDESLKKMYLAQDRILELFNDKGENSGDKMIAFVPTKCEFYLRRNKGGEVKARIEKEFRDLFEKIRELNGKKKKYEVYFTPVQTIGGVEFTEIIEDEKGKRADFWRTKPGSQFKPENTDLLFLFCLKYLFGIFFQQSAAQITLRQMDPIKEKIEEMDEKSRKLDSDIEEYNKCKIEGQKKEIFGRLLRKFFSEYRNDRRILESVFDKDGKTKQCYIVDCGGKKLEEDFETEFRKNFIKF